MNRICISVQTPLATVYCAVGGSFDAVCQRGEPVVSRGVVRDTAGRARAAARAADASPRAPRTPRAPPARLTPPRCAAGETTQEELLDTQGRYRSSLQAL